jgi:hypothetical protein
MPTWIREEEQGALWKATTERWGHVHQRRNYILTSLAYF